MNKKEKQPKLDEITISIFDSPDCKVVFLNNEFIFAGYEFDTIYLLNQLATGDKVIKKLDVYNFSRETMKQIMDGEDGTPTDIRKYKRNYIFKWEAKGALNGK